VKLNGKVRRNWLSLPEVFSRGVGFERRMVLVDGCCIVDAVVELSFEGDAIVELLVAAVLDVTGLIEDKAELEA
jgi:hypothetical protein